MTSLRFLLRYALTGTMLLTAATTAWAATPSFSNAVQPELPDTTPKQAPDAPQALPPSPEQLTSQLTAMQEQLRGKSLADLQKNPELAEKALNLAIISRNWEAVREILPVYRQMPNHDQVLVNYAQGGLYAGDGEYKKAIALYRKMIADDPTLSRVRMDLAILLYADKQDIAARDQFVKLRSEPGNDAVINETIDEFLAGIDQRSAWSFDAGLSYLHDDNVNNASKSKTIRAGRLNFTKRPEALPQSGQGYEFSLGAAKDFNIIGSNYISFDTGTNGKIYWNNHDYDDISLNISSGYKYKDARNSFGIAPLARWRIVGGNAYSRTFGFSLQGSRWLSPNWQLSSHNEMGWEKSNVDKKAPTEKQIYTSLNALWAPKSSQYFMLGANLYDDDTGIKSTSYLRPGTTFVWNQDWPIGGISSRLNLGYGHRHYKGQSYFGIKRKDNEFNTGVTLWKRDWHYWGITPKLSFRFNKVNSNIDDLYSYDKAQIFLKFDKTF